MIAKKTDLSSPIWIDFFYILVLTVDFKFLMCSPRLWTSMSTERSSLVKRQKIVILRAI